MYTYNKKLTVFTLCSNTDSIQVLLHQAEKCSISLVEQFNITYDGKEPKRCLDCKETTNLEKIQGTLFMFQPETGFHTNSLFSVSG